SLNALMNAARVGPGNGKSPFRPCQSTRLNSTSLLSSSLTNENCSDFFCHLFIATFFSSRLTRGAMALNENGLASALKQFHIGVAAASYWVMGSIPKINSIVRSIEAVV